MMRRLRNLQQWLRRDEHMCCGDCGRWGDQFIDFLVCTTVWNYVMSGGLRDKTVMCVRPGLFSSTLTPRAEGMGGVVCLPCFDRRARTLNVPYHGHIIIFGSDCWMGSDYVGGMPA